MAMHKRLCMPSIAQLYAPQCQAARRGDARAPATITTSSPQLLPSNRTVNHPQHRIMVDLTADAPPPAKKVRVACRRCRAKRVKCDGGLPACGNSARAKVSCVDVDTGKRPYDSVENSEVERPLSFEARSVAIDLGMLSLHSDSRQKHYLGSSSALLFMKVIGAGAEVKASGPVSSFPATAHRRRVSSHRPSGEIYHSLYSSLKKELPSPEDADLLLAVYFQSIHIDHPFLHPTSLIDAYHALYVSIQRGYVPGKLGPALCAGTFGV